MGKKIIDVVIYLFILLFNKYILFFLLFIFFYIIFWFMGVFYYEGVFLESWLLGSSLFVILLIYVGLIGLVFFYEFGYVVVLVYYKEFLDFIGFGFYLVFLVFFIDVISIWNFNCWKWIVVNIGGIYF